ncbi:restriction endonuclease subunit S [Rhodococcus sp. Q]|uniref:restriction endonuclease subunit S n=1 Tax=Rhodococcus sp. Q TaxID=2502252 RepID=UPI0010F5DDEE|nr:restriction endonuclease subunit S [Rhodococcus sp. Q]
MTLTWSGAPDLPQVPFGRLFRRLDRPVPEGAEIVTAYTDGQVTLRSNRAKIGYHEAADLSSFKGVEIGDFVVHGLDILRGSVGIADSAGAITAVCTVCEPIADLDLRYVAHAIHVQAKSGFTRALARGIREGGADFRRWGTLAELPIPMPPVGYQRAVCDYLDRETARIDTLIEEQQRLIETLRERREATIRSALLAGLDDAETAPSGVELLGAVPKHWRMVPTRYLCTITTGSEDSGNATDDGEYPFYVRGREVLRIDHYSFEGEAVMTPGDGQGGTGKVFHYFDGKFEAHQRVYVFKDFTEVTGWYFYYFLSTFLRPVALAGSNTVTMESLRRPLLADFKVAVPQIDEQQRITAYLDNQIEKIDTLIAETERFVEIARERRAALITAAVTGQIDVREMV